MTTLFYPFTDNIGDDIQSILLLCITNKIDQIFSRDEIPSSVSKIKSSGIINGWLSKNSDLEFDPFLLANFCPPASFHISEQAEKIHLNRLWLEYFSNSEFCLTRDLHTLNLLKSKNIEAKFGGCLTLLLNKFFTKVEQCEFNLHTEYDYFIENGDENSIFFNPHCFTWQFIYSLPVRIGLTLMWMALISSAKKIFTKRLHTALPCFSFNGFDNQYFEFLSFNNLPTGNSSRLSGYENLLKLKKNSDSKGNKLISTSDVIIAVNNSFELISKKINYNKEYANKIKKYELKDTFNSYSYFVRLIYNQQISEENLKACFSLSIYAFSKMLKCKKVKILNELVWLKDIINNPITNLPENCSLDISTHLNFYR